ncbi:hypothetical protein JNUCC0626_47855 [Lentzea sp. JNUCC 0626]|uniref:hypothetical protein n=1 Tax=Lentzea sp. JNUCC 0626 TaxID=3367513 RepID=UPI00374930AB
MFKRVLSTLSAAAIFCTGAVLIASPAQAADTQFRIIFVGSKIPSWAKSAEVNLFDGLGVRCVKDLTPGQDLDTGIVKSVPDGSRPGSEARSVRIGVYSARRCDEGNIDPRFSGTWEAPQAALSGVNRWRIELS